MGMEELRQQGAGEKATGSALVDPWCRPANCHHGKSPARLQLESGLGMTSRQYHLNTCFHAAFNLLSLARQPVVQFGEALFFVWPSFHCWSVVEHVACGRIIGRTNPKRFKQRDDFEGLRKPHSGGVSNLRTVGCAWCLFLHGSQGRPDCYLFGKRPSVLQVVKSLWASGCPSVLVEWRQGRVLHSVSVLGSGSWYSEAFASRLRAADGLHVFVVEVIK